MLTTGRPVAESSGRGRDICVRRSRSGRLCSGESAGAADSTHSGDLGRLPGPSQCLHPLLLPALLLLRRRGQRTFGSDSRAGGGGGRGEVLLVPAGGAKVRGIAGTLRT